MTLAQARPSAAVGVLASLAFFAGVATFESTGHGAAEGAFAASDAPTVLAVLAAHRTVALAGIALHLVGLAGWLVYFPALAELLPDTARPAARAGFLGGTVLALMAFTTVFAAILDGDATLLRAGLLGDVVATWLILALGIGTTSVAGHRAGWLPRPLAALGLVVGPGWTLHVLGIGTALQAPTVLFAPLAIAWMVGTGIVVLRAAPGVPAAVGA